MSARRSARSSPRRTPTARHRPRPPRRPSSQPAVPSSTAAPAVSGSAREGQLLSATQGTWKGTPAIAYAYGWERCGSGTCAAIAGESAAAYRLAAADVGRSVRATVTASNAGGTTTVASAQTATVTGGVAVNVAVPDIAAALPRDGELYSATLGSWGGSAPLVLDRQWLRCNATGASCTPLSGEVAATYRVVAADIGRTLRLEATATNAFGATKAQSAPSPVILAAPPAAAAPPVITGTLRDGQTLTAMSSWSGTAPIALTHQWQRCDALTATCADIAGATAATYVPASADVGARMRVRIGALNAGGGGVATSDLAAAGDPAGLVAPDAPHATAAPTLTGTAMEESTLTSGDGVFSGTLPITRTTRWQRCDGAGANCADIAGALGATRVLDAADRGRTLRSVVTAVNGSGSDSSASVPSAVVAPAPPRSLVAPSVSPDTGLRDGATLLSTDGGWAGSQPMTLAYRWQRCTSPTACVDVAGARGPTYMLSASDAGFALRIVVTASNGAGATAQAAAPTGIVGTNPPVNVVAPTVAGTARDGDVLTAADGLWIGPIVFQTTYDWWRCDPAGANCTIVPGAMAQSYVTGAADIGLTLRGRVTRTSAGGQTAAFTLPTAAVVAAPPRNLGAPQISGAAGVGRTLTAARGAWAGTETIGYTHQWRRCAADGSACADIDGAVAPTYALAAGDGHASLRVVVTATNAVGSAPATSAATAEVQTDPPAGLTAPQIVAPAGPLAAGAALSSQAGTWAGSLPIAFAYEWRRCDTAQAACSPISGATASSYALVTADVGKRIVLSVTATNAVASAASLSAATAAVLPEPPSNVAPPVVTASAGARAGARVTATAGTWNGATPLTYTTTWLRCDAGGAACTVVAGATGTSYTLTAADVGSRMRARVTAANATAETGADSAPSGAVTAAAAPAATPATPAPTPAATPRPAATAPAPVATTTTTPATKTGTTKTKPGAKTAGATGAQAKATAKRRSKHPIAELARLRMTPGGVVLVVLRCPRARTRACGVSGTIVAATALGEVVADTPLTFRLRPGSLPRGRSVVRPYKLTTAQRAALKDLTAVNLRLRLAAPARPRSVSEVFVHVRVPVRLRAG